MQLNPMHIYLEIQLITSIEIRSLVSDPMIVAYTGISNLEPAPILG